MEYGHVRIPSMGFGRRGSGWDMMVDRVVLFILYR